MLKASALVAVLLGSLAGCSSTNDDSPSYECEGKCDDASSDPLWTDRVLEKTAEILGRERGRSFRYAFDRAVNELGGFNVEAWPDGNCYNSQPDQLFWNGEDRSLHRLGIVGLANVLALEAISFEGYEEYHTSFLSAAPGADGDAAHALQIIATLDSPKLLHAAVSALSQNGHLSAGARRTLLAFDAELTATKRFRADDLGLRLPDLAHPISTAALIDRLRAQPAPGYRIALAQILAQNAGAATAAEIDSLLTDTDAFVRIAAMPLFWQGSNTSVARQNELLAWIDGAEAKRQIRLKFLGALTDAEASGWADEPHGFIPFYLETVAEFVGAALEAPPANANIRPFLARAGAFRNISNIVEDAAVAALRSTALTAQEKEQTLVALLPAATTLRDDGIGTASSLIWRLLAQRMLEAPRADLVTELQSIWTPHTLDRAAIDAQLTSSDPATRLAGVKAFAPFEPGFMAAVFDAGAGETSLLAHQNGFVLLAALESGVSPQIIIDLVLGMARQRPGDPEAWLEFWNGSEAPYLQALLAAIQSPQLSDAERKANILAFARVISPRNTLPPTGAPGPGALYIGSYVHAILEGLGNDEDAWEAVLVKDTGPALRTHLLDYTPDRGPIRTLVKRLVRPNLVVDATVCWTGNSSTATRRPGLSVWAIPYALSLATAPLDPDEVVDARIDQLREASESTSALPATATVDSILATHPIAKDAYFGAFPWTQEKRVPYELPVADVAARLLAAPSTAYWEHVNAIALAPDLDTLPAATIAQLDAMLAPQASFAIHLARGESYDALAQRFSASIPLRWDLAHQARMSGGESAALERLLATAERAFLVSYELTNLVSRVAAKANVSDAFRHSLAGLSADGQGAWSSGPLPLARMRGTSLDEAVLAGAAYRTAQPQTIDLPPAHLVGTVVRDLRLSPDAALRLAWITLSGGQFRPGDFNETPATITYAVDMTLGVMARTDVSDTDKAALGRALLTVLE